MIKLISYQPDIPQNLGGLIRLTACLNVSLEIIEPCGFPLGDRGLKRVAMDYHRESEIKMWKSWDKYLKNRPIMERIVLLSTRAEKNYHEFSFKDNDALIVGRETGGVPDKVREIADYVIKVPIMRNLRSLNVVTAASIVIGEALRQTDNLKKLD